MPDKRQSMNSGTTTPLPSHVNFTQMSVANELQLLSKHEVRLNWEMGTAIRLKGGAAKTSPWLPSTSPSDNRICRLVSGQEKRPAG